MKTKKLAICDKCGKTLYPIKSLSNLTSLPYEWYIDKNLFKKYDVYACNECHIIFRKRKLLSYYWNKILSIVFKEVRRAIP